MKTITIHVEKWYTRDNPYIKGTQYAPCGAYSAYYPRLLVKKWA